MPLRSTTGTILMTGCIALFAMLVQGCASDHPATPIVTEPKRMINDIMTIQAADSLTVVVKGDQPLTYTLLPQDSPQALVIRFANTGLDRLGPIYFPPENMAVHSIRTEQISENGMEVRVVLGLRGGIPYQLVPEENSLKVVFSKTKAPAPIPTPRRGQQAPKQRPPSPAVQSAATASGVLKGVNVVSHGGGVAVHIRVDGQVTDYKAFTIDEPPPAKIAVDLMGLRSAFRDEQRIPVEGQIVKQVRHFGHPDRVRVVVETEKAYLKNFSLKPVEDGMVLTVGTSTGKEN